MLKRKKRKFILKPPIFTYTHGNNVHPSSWWNGLLDQSLVTDLLRYFSIFTPAHGEMDCWINPLWQTYWGISQSSPQLMVKWIVGSIPYDRPIEVFLNLHSSSWWNGLLDQSLVTDLLRYFSIFTPAHGLLDQSLMTDLLRYFSIFTPAHGEMDCWINPLWQTYWGISQSSPQLMDCWINSLWQT